MRMSGEQFDLLLRLMRGNAGSPSARAARRVLVDGVTQNFAVLESGLTRSSVSDAVARYQEADRLIRGAYGGDSICVYASRSVQSNCTDLGDHWDEASMTIKNATQAIKELSEIERPDGDNEGDAINSRYVYDSLSLDDQIKVDEAVQTLKNYTRNPDGTPNRRSVTALNKRGHQTSLDPYQYDPSLLAGHTQAGEWTVDLSDDLSDDE